MSAVFRPPMRRVLSPAGAPAQARRMHPAGATPRISGRTAAASADLDPAGSSQGPDTTQAAGGTA